MHLRSLFGWGIAVYAVLNLVWSALVVHGLSNTLIGRGCMIVALIVLVAIASRSLRLISERDAVVYGIGWVLIAALLDAILTVPIAGWAVYTNLNTWVGYGLLFAVPLVVTALSRQRLE